MLNSQSIITRTLLLLVCFFVCSSAYAADYDLVILNGRVMDPETMMDAVRNVGVKDGKIAAITTEKIRGKETINARDHVVAPGFIDTHSHTVVTEIGQKIHLRDGVTTALELEAGVYPVGLWYDSWEGRGQVNYGATASFIGARETEFNPDYKTADGANVNDILLPTAVGMDFAWSATVATDEQIASILGRYEEG